jgi:5-methylthioadenosine/S-adenosylhomocysteine deaminase
MPAAEQLDAVARFLDRWHGHAGRITGAIGPSGPQRCSDALLLGAHDLARGREVIFHMHVLETRIQRAMGFRLYGQGMMAHLATLGLLDRRANLVHAIWLEDGDIELIGNADAAVVHNPVSNARLGSGICRLAELLARGIRVGLGTDSACCNDSNNLLETTKWAGLLHNLHLPDPGDWISPERSLRLATSGGADVLGLGAVTGRLEVGYAADIVLLRTASPAFAPLIDPVRQLVLGESGTAVDTALVGGEIVLRDGRCTTVDENAIWTEVQELAERRLHDNASVYSDAARLEGPIRRMSARIAQKGCCQ